MSKIDFIMDEAKLMWSRNAAASGQTSLKRKWVIGITLKLSLHDQLPLFSTG